MPVREATQLILGRGELYFEQLSPDTLDGDGERYVGNTTSVRIEREVTRIERKTSFGGRLHDVPGAVIGEEQSVSIMTDNVDIENLALWFGTSVKDNLPLPALNESETLTVKQGRSYQIGKSYLPVIGLKNLQSAQVFRSGSPVTPTGNYEIDLADGRVHILRDAPNIPDNSSIRIDFTAYPVGYDFDYAYPTVLPNGDEIYGSLRFVPKNAVGPQVRYFWPFVRITPRGQTDLKNDEFQQWGFEVSVMRIHPDIPAMIVESGQKPGFLAKNDITRDEFTTVEGLFDTIINSNLPG